MAKEHEQTDILGQPLKIGDHVATVFRNSMYICKITKITPKMIRAHIVTQSGYGDNPGQLCYSHNTVLLSGPDAVAYILAYAK